MMNEFQKEIERTNSMQRTENGALGYSTTGKNLVDLNFKVPSFRNGVDTNSLVSFYHAMEEDLTYAVKWLFYVRDAREGLGERRAFVEFFTQFYSYNREKASKVLGLIGEYGRWKDIFDLIGCSNNVYLKEDCLKVVKEQLMKDVTNFTEGKNISLLAKWVPSINASDKARKVALELRNHLGLNNKEYRQMLSKLRNHIGIVETMACSGNWGDINYETVPSKANLKYKDAFMKHDEERRSEFLNAVLDTTSEDRPKINASVLYPYEIWAKYTHGDLDWYGRNIPEDKSLEALWQNMKDIDCGGNTMVVCDGSASMCSRIPGANDIMALDVARSLSVYFAERCEGEFKNKFIEFSLRPQFIDINGCDRLVDKIKHVSQYTDSSNTDIEKVFMLLLNTAINNKMSQSDLPERILVVSDMEFDYATTIYYGWSNENDFMNRYKTLFETLGERYKRAGFIMPKLVFWNVNSRTNTIPLRENEAGVILVSGYSVNIAKMVMSGKTDPWDALKETLDKERYAPVGEALNK